MLFKAGKNKSLKLERLYDKYKNVVLARATSILKDKMLAEDAVSETFARVSRVVDKVDEDVECKAMSFLLTTCRNVAIDISNKNKKERPSDFAETEPFNEPVYENNPENIVISSETYEIIIAAIGELKPIYKDVIVFSCVHELTCRETAAVLGITPEAAEKRIQRAKKILREKLKKEELL